MELVPALQPIAHLIEAVTDPIKSSDARIAELADERDLATRVLRPASGVEPVTALCSCRPWSLSYDHRLAM